MSPRRFFYTLSGILAVGVIAFGGAYYLTAKRLHASTQTLSQRLSDEEVADNRISKLQDLQTQYNRLGPLLPVIANALPAQKEQSTLALQLHDIAAASQMQLDSLTFTASQQPGPTSQTIKVGDVLAIPITFQLVGNYAQLQQFLQLQEHLNRYSSITSLDIGTDPSTGKLSFNIALNVFMKP